MTSTRTKTYVVLGTYGTRFGVVHAPRKAVAMAMAERDFKLEPKTFYLSVDEGFRDQTKEWPQAGGWVR